MNIFYNGSIFLNVEKPMPVEPHRTDWEGMTDDEIKEQHDTVKRFEKYLSTLVSYPYDNKDGRLKDEEECKVVFQFKNATGGWINCSESYYSHASGSCRRIIALPVEEKKESAARSLTAHPVDSHKTLLNVMKVVDEWLKSNDVFVTDKEGGEVIPGAWVECIKGSLLKRMCKVVPDDTKI